MQAIEKSPDTEAFYFAAASRLARSAQRDRAVEIINRLIERFPENPRGHVFLALQHKRDNRVEQALSHFRKAAVLNPEELALRKAIADLLVESGRFDEAVVTLEKALKETKKRETAYALLGNLYVNRSENTQDPDEANRYRDEGIALFTKAAEEFPHQRLFRSRAAQLELAKGNIVKALDQYAHLEELEPDNVSLKRLITRGLATGLGGPEQALNRLQEVYPDRPEDALTPFYIGQLLEDLKRANEALPYYEQATQRAPKSGAAHWRRASILSTTKPAEALTLLLAAEKELPEHILILESSAYLLAATNRHAEAVSFFERTQKAYGEKAPESRTGRFPYFFAISALHTDNLALAETQIRKAATIKSELLGLFVKEIFELDNDTAGDADGEAGRKRIKAAALAAEGILADYPDEALSRIYLGMLFSYTREYPRAVKAFDQAEAAIRKSPEGEKALTAQFFFSAGAANERVGNLERAEELFRLCIEKDPKNAEAYNYLAYTWAENNMRLREAVDLVDQALKLDPGNGAYLDTKGWILYQQKKYKQALPLLEASLKALRDEGEDDDPTILDHLGDTHAKLKQFEQAIAFYEQTLKAEPEDPEAITKKKTAAEKDLKAQQAEAKKRAAEAKAAAKKAKAEAEAKAKAEAKAAAEAAAKAKAEAEAAARKAAEDAATEPAPTPPEPAPAPDSNASDAP